MFRKAFPLLLLMAAPVLLAADRPASANPTEIGINTDFNLIFVPVQLSDGVHWMVMDTGAPYTVVEYDAMVALGVEVQDLQTLDQPGGKVTVGKVGELDFQVGGRPVQLQDVRAAQMKKVGLNGIMGKDVLGVLGFDFIDRFTIEVDYQAGKMRIFDKDTYEYAGNGKVVPINLEGTRPLIEGTVRDAGKEFPGTFLMDTGSLMFIGLQKSFVQENGCDRDGNVLDSVGLGFGGTSPAKLLKVDGFAFGGYSFDDCVTGYADDDVLASMPFDGVLGGELLRRYDVVIDYRRSRVILEPNLSLYEPVLADRTGMMYLAKGDRFDTVEVIYVHDRSPAARAGIRSGDELVTINGMEASRITVPKIWRGFRGDEGLRFDLVVRRDGELLARELTLEDFIP